MHLHETRYGQAIRTKRLVPLWPADTTTRDLTVHNMAGVVPGLDNAAETGTGRRSAREVQRRGSMVRAPIHRNKLCPGAHGIQETFHQRERAPALQAAPGAQRKDGLRMESIKAPEWG